MMTGGTVVERVRQAIDRLLAQGESVSLASICREDRRAGGRLAHTSILRNDDAKALYLTHRNAKAPPRLRLRGLCRDATGAEADRLRRYLSRPRLALAMALLVRDAELRLLTTELAAYRAMEHRGELAVPRGPINVDEEITRYHQLLVRRREFMAVYRPALLKALAGGRDAP